MQRERSPKPCYLPQVVITATSIHEDLPAVESLFFTQATIQKVHSEKQIAVDFTGGCPGWFPITILRLERID